MQIQALGSVLLTPTPQRDAQFYVLHFGFTYAANMSWYVSLHHPCLNNFALDFIDGHHSATPTPLQGETTTAFVALVVQDAQTEAERLEAAGLSLIKPLTDEPWGQRRFQVAGPGGAVIEIVQQIAADEAWLKANQL